MDRGDTVGIMTFLQRSLSTTMDPTHPPSVPRKNILDLPSEILLGVLTWLNPHDITVCMPICRRSGTDLLERNSATPLAWPPAVGIAHHALREGNDTEPPPY